MYVRREGYGLTAYYIQPLACEVRIFLLVDLWVYGEKSDLGSGRQKKKVTFKAFFLKQSPEQTVKLVK